MKKIETSEAPKAVGPYSQALVVGDFVYCSGQIGIDPKTGELVGGIKDQTKRVLDSLQAVLAAAGSGLDLIVKTEVYLKNMQDYAVMNEIYGEYFSGDVGGSPLPARVTVGVAELPKNALVEISCVALKK